MNVADSELIDGILQHDPDVVSGSDTFCGWVTTALTLNLIRDNESEQIDHDVVLEFTSSENKFIRGMAQRIIDQHTQQGGQHGG